MKQNNSPWLTQLHPNRKAVLLEKDTETDIVIIGGGIAGVTTLYYLLTQTNKNIILIEGSKIAHGATGHNAGQVVAEFERSFASIIDEYGKEKAIDGLRMIENAWELLDDILEKTDINIPFQKCTGYGGFTELGPLLEDLETEYIKWQEGFMTFPTLISKESNWMKEIPEKFHSICSEVELSEIYTTLNIVRDGFHAALPHRIAVLNSALFTEQLALWCLKNYPDRTQIFEQSFVHGIELSKESVTILTNQATVICDNVVVCTNGFENFYIKDRTGMEIDTKFHHLIQGVVGYMTGYLTNKELDPMGNYYYDPLKNTGPLPDPYYYVTRRKFGNETNPEYLMAVGGPEVHLVEREIYFRDFDVSEKFRDDAIIFAQNHFDMTDFDQKFFWHGLMGYTKSGVRMVGPEPIDPRLLYNLGCNGIGILPSIMGAKKISKHINHEIMSETIFDPKR